MYSNMKYYENIWNCFRVIQQDINRKLKSANCWQQTSLRAFLVDLKCSWLQSGLADLEKHKILPFLFMVDFLRIFKITQFLRFLKKN